MDPLSGQRRVASAYQFCKTWHSLNLYFGQWTPPCYQSRDASAKYQYTKIGRWISTLATETPPCYQNRDASAKFGVHKTWQMNLLWQMVPFEVHQANRYLEYCYTKLGRWTFYWPSDPCSGHQCRDALAKVGSSTQNMCSGIQVISALANGGISGNQGITEIPLNTSTANTVFWWTYFGMMDPLVPWCMLDALHTSTTKLGRWTYFGNGHHHATRFQRCSWMTATPNLAKHEPVFGQMTPPVSQIMRWLAYHLHKTWQIEPTLAKVGPPICQSILMYLNTRYITTMAVLGVLWLMVPPSTRVLMYLHTSTSKLWHDEPT